MDFANFISNIIIINNNIDIKIGNNFLDFVLFF